MITKRPVVIIGLDGADFSVLDREIARGRLPVLKEILEKGAHAPFRSTVPPLTFPAWTTFATGVNPGRHGIFDFSEKVAGSHKLRFVNARWRKAPAFWSLLSEAGRRVAVLGVPVTYPPEKINGLMVCGFDAPGVGGGRIDAASTYPSEFAARLLQAVPDYWLGANLQGLGTDYDQMLARLLKVLDDRLEAFLWTYRLENWDCFVGVVGETDAVCHYFWRFYDVGSPFHEAARAHLGEAIGEVYRRVDAFLGRLLEAMPKDATLILVSDHGMGSSSDLSVRLNAYLARLGLLSFTPKSLTQRGLELTKRMVMRLVPPRLKRLIFRHTRLVEAVEGRIRFGYLNWTETLAYSEEPPQFPSVYLNLQGREPQGIVSPEDYLKVAEKVRQALLAFRGPEGTPLIRQVWLKEELFRGPAVERAPDLLIEWAEDPVRGHPQFLRSSPGDSPLEKMTAPQEFWLVNRGACHRPHGIFIAFGEGVNRPQEIAPLPGLEDIAPTVLLLQGVSEAPPLEGRVLAEVFPDLAGTALKRGAEISVEAEERITAKEEEEVMEKLKALGYL